jgi:hypothetical protein
MTNLLSFSISAFLGPFLSINQSPLLSLLEHILFYKIRCCLIVES